MNNILNLFKGLLFCKCESECCESYDETTETHETKNKIHKRTILNFKFNNKKTNTPPETPQPQPTEIFI